MAEYIEREALIKRLDASPLLDNPNDHALFKFIKLGVLDLIEKQPAADVAPVRHGKWMYGKWVQGHWLKGNERCRCSVCDRDFAIDNLNIWNGCPHCLAKMDGNGEGE